MLFGGTDLPQVKQNTWYMEWLDQALSYLTL